MSHGFSACFRLSVITLTTAWICDATCRARSRDSDFHTRRHPKNVATWKPSSLQLYPPPQAGASSTALPCPSEHQCPVGCSDDSVHWMCRTSCVHELIGRRHLLGVALSIFSNGRRGVRVCRQNSRIAVSSPVHLLQFHSPAALRTSSRTPPGSCFRRRPLVRLQASLILS